MHRNLDLFEHVAGAYMQTHKGILSNEELYRIAAGRAGLPKEELNRVEPIGQDGKLRSTAKRSIRWHQQTLRNLGFLEKVEGQRGVWALTKLGKSKLRTIRDDVAVIAYSTDLGIAIWGNSNHVMRQFDEPIFLALTSLPYPLRTPRAYGNPSLQDYTDFVSNLLEPVVRNLVPGGNVALSLSNDIFEPGSPARSLYLEKLTITLYERFGLHLMDRLVWESNKPPGPIQWASLSRIQLNVGYEPILWFCNAPKLCIADNRRVLEPHSEQHRNLITRGGERRNSNNSDGAYRVKPGNYSSPTSGRIPRNVFYVSNVCKDQRAYKAKAKALGLQPHGAPMPLALARKLVRFLSDVGQLVVDFCAGSNTTGRACEIEQRPWMSVDNVYDYVRGGGERFRDSPGFSLNLPD